MTANPPLGKAYEPSAIESKWYRFWEEQGFFHADASAPKTPYAIVIPPPNVTGSLHMGHALGFTIQDILVRWRRMVGHNAMWLPGTDHAGIATQMVVERELLKTEGKSRHDLGRDEFLKRVWSWKGKYGDRILEQMRAMGFSLDWSRLRFTMDDAYSAAVVEAFVRLHEDGLIYRARRLINWCSRCYTALSDLEVEHTEVDGSLWHIAYPVVGTDERLVVATTRPETLLGDTAVAIHPDDERYRHLLAGPSNPAGARVHLPLTDRDIPVIGDPLLVDPKFGSGVVKVTPGHDFNDFECGQRNQLEQLSVIDAYGKLCAPAPERFVGLTVVEARKKIIEELDAGGFLVRTEPHKLSRGHCQRCDTVVEPFLSLQWFVQVDGMAKEAVAAVEQGKTKIVPESWTKVYFHWMNNIRDWCISRQLWWGHRIPAYHCGACAHITVARTAPAACAKCGSADLVQDEDVLDTWFSSSLWPMATLGWPNETRELKTFYPTSVLETGYDILFFWVARMMMMGLYFRKKVPFRTVMLHAMVVDEHGDKMSKVKGNVLDPLDVIHGVTGPDLAAKTPALTAQFPKGIAPQGADALRFTMAALAAQGRSIRLAVARVEGYRHFANKLWNASRFALMYLDGFDADSFATALQERSEGVTDGVPIELTLAERWILSRLQRTSAQVNEALSELRINDAAQLLYRFVWNELCDWYIELAKPTLHAGTSATEAGDAPSPRLRGTQGTLALALETTMRLAHPFMPFITEEIWHQLPKGVGAPQSISITVFPSEERSLLDPEAEESMELLQQVITAIRTLRSEYRVPPAAWIPATLQVASDELLAKLEAHRVFLTQQAKIEQLQLARSSTAPAGSVSAVLPGIEIFVPLAGLVDIAAERSRLVKELEKSEVERSKIETKLANPEFRDRAPAAIIEKQQTLLSELHERVERIQAALTRLPAA